MAECDLSRLTLRHEILGTQQAFQANIDRVKSTLLSGRTIIPVALGATSLLGFFFRKKGRVSRAPSLLAKVIGGWQLFQRVKPLWDAYQIRRRTAKAQTPE